MAANLGGGDEEEEAEEAAAAGRGSGVGRDVGRAEAEPGDRLNAEASLPGSVPRILIFDVFPGERETSTLHTGLKRCEIDAFHS